MIGKEYNTDLLLKWTLNLPASRVAQWKRAGPITQRSVDRNHALLNFFLLLPRSAEFFPSSFSFSTIGEGETETQTWPAQNSKT